MHKEITNGKEQGKAGHRKTTGQGYKQCFNVSTVCLHQEKINKCLINDTFAQKYRYTIRVMEIFKAPTPRLKSLNKHSTSRWKMLTRNEHINTGSSITMCKTHARTHARTHACTHSRTHTHTHTHTHTRARARARAHTHIVQTDRCEGQCCLTELEYSDKRQVLSLLLKEERVGECLMSWKRFVQLSCF